MMGKSYRPGVYSRYDIISRQKSCEDRYAFFCGGAKVRDGKSLPAGGVVQLRTVKELNEYFEPQGSGKVFNAVCSILLGGGVGGVYVVPITIDGTEPQAAGYTAAFTKLCELKRSGVILCDSTDEDVLYELSRKVVEASQNERERVAVGGAANGTAAEIAGKINCERMVMCAQEGKTAFAQEQSVIYTAAAMAAMLAVAEVSESLNGAELDILESVEELSEEEIEAMLGSGVTVLETNEDRVECIRCVTTRTTTDGEEDRTFSSVNVVLMIDEIIRTVRERLKGMLKGHRAGFSYDSIASQVAVILDEKVQQGLVTSFEPPIVYSQEDDPSVCVVELEFALAAVVSQIYLTAHISV